MLTELAADRRFKGLVFTFLILACVGIAAYTYLTYMQAKYMVGNIANITVTGTSDTYVAPDVATFSFSVVGDEKDVKTAQDKSATAMNDIKAFLKEKGVDEKDVKTSDYNISPKYEYVAAVCNQMGFCPPGKQNLTGYTVTETVTVKVRNVDSVGDLISGVGEKGATNMSGLSFTVDDPDKAKEQVRDEAIADAKAKAQKLASDLGVHLGRLVSYGENGPYPMPYATSYGGTMMEKAADMAAVAPTISPGQNQITSEVTLVYEIR